MSDLSLHPVYLSARAAIVAPERAVPVTFYAIQKWLPRLGPERWCLVMLLRGLSIDTPRRSNNTKRVTCSWRELADMLDVHEETVASWLKHRPLPNDKPWRCLIPSDEKSRYLSLFIPRLRYAYETHNGKTRRVGFLLEILMEDPVVPEDVARLERQVELLRLQQGELGLETYRLSEEVNRSGADLPGISRSIRDRQLSDLPYVNPAEPELPRPANQVSTDLRPWQVNPDNSDLLTGVKQDNPGLDGYVNLPAPGLPLPKSEESRKNVNELDILIQQLKHNNFKKNLRKSAFEPVIRVTESLLEDNHSAGMLFKVLNALYPRHLDLYAASVRVALEAAGEDPQVNRGAVFVRTLRDFADVAGVELGLKRAGEQEPEDESEEGGLGTQVPRLQAPSPAPFVVDENEAIWAETQSELRRQMTRATYDAVIQGTVLLGQENNVYWIGVQTEMAKEWLENRLRDVVQRCLSTVVGLPVTVKFTVRSDSR